MTVLHNRWFRYCIIAICSVVVASGCIIRRENLRAGYTNIAPLEYCPSDPMTASFDLLGSDVCPAGVDCAPFFPVVAISSAPVAFPEQSITNYVGSVSFTAPDADQFIVTFNPDRDNVLIPTAESTPDGRVFIQRESLDQARIARRISTVNQELVHNGMCAGSTPVNSTQTLPGLPQFSANLRLTDLCNVNAVPVVVTLSGGADGSSYTQTLSPGQCLNAMPGGVPANSQDARVVEVRPANIDPSTRCTATGPLVPPPALRTRIQMVCR
jgi:hypothetical protein